GRADRRTAPAAPLRRRECPRSGELWRSCAASPWALSFASRDLAGRPHRLRRRHGARNVPRDEATNASARDDLDLAVAAGHDAELALEGLVVVTRDRAIFALRQDHAREGADRFLDHVAAGREHRPLRVGAGFATTLVHELERDDGGAMIDRGIGELADL